jgi:hypothetical protein
MAFGAFLERVAQWFQLASARTLLRQATLSLPPSAPGSASHTLCLLPQSRETVWNPNLEVFFYRQVYVSLHM